MLSRRPTSFVLAALLGLGLGLAVLLDRQGRAGGTGGMVDPAVPATAVAADDLLPTPSTPTLATGWQVSAPRPGLDDAHAGQPVELGLRQRYAGPADRFTAQVEVTDPTGAVATAPLAVTADEWAFLIYPADFPGAGPTHSGVHRVRYLVDGAPVAEDGFLVR